MVSGPSPDAKEAVERYFSQIGRLKFHVNSKYFKYF
jgi:hypothetical protein